jgi:hypothetical protein
MSNNVINFSDIPAAKGCDTIPGGNKISNLKITMEPVTMPEQPNINVGINDLKDVALAGAAFGNAIYSAIADDGKINLADAAKFFTPVMKLPAAISGIGNVPAEIDDLQESEIEEIKKLIADELDIKTNVEEIVTYSIELIWQVKELVEKIKAAKTA